MNKIGIKEIGIIGMSRNCGKMAHVETLLIEHFGTSEGKLIIVGIEHEKMTAIIERMKEINPKLLIVIADNPGDYKEILKPSGSFEDKLKTFEFTNVERMIEPVIVHDKKMQFGENYRREQRFRSQRHDFNSKNYRR